MEQVGLTQWFLARDEFISQGTGSVRHFWLSHVAEARSTDIYSIEARDAAQHPTTYRAVSQQGII